jgi:solute carrier family 35 protein F1/2
MVPTGAGTAAGSSHSSHANNLNSKNQTNMKAAEVDQEDDQSQISYDPSLNSIDISMEDSSDSHSQPQSIQQPMGIAAKIQHKFLEGFQRFFAHWRILLLGQFLSLLLACSSALSASMHFECNISSPTFQTALVFSLMSFHAVALIKKNTDKQEQTKLVPADPQDPAFGGAGVSNLSLGGSISLDSMDHANNQETKNERGNAHSNKQKINGTDIDIDNENENTISTSLSSSTSKTSATSKSHSMCCGVLSLNLEWWCYAAFALIAVEASYFTFLAYRYTTLPSCALLDNTNILAAMIGSRIILKRKYSATHVLGALICCLGVVFNLFSDFEKAKEDITTVDDFAEQTEVVEYPKRMLGDILAIVGGLLVGFSDVLIELFVKDFVSIHEFLGCVGIWGTFIAATQALIMERSQIAKIFAAGGEENDMSTQDIYEAYADDPFNAPRSCSRETALALVFGYAVSTYLFNYSISRFLSMSESALMTLSLLTADLYSVIFTVVAEHIPPTGLFYLAFFLVVVGVVVYEMAPSPLGDAEDLVMERGIELEKLQDFGSKNVQLSWGSKDFGGDDDSSVDRHEIL